MSDILIVAIGIAAIMVYMFALIAMFFGDTETFQAIDNRIARWIERKDNE